MTQDRAATDSAPREVSNHVPQWQEWLLDPECDSEKVEAYRQLATRLVAAERIRIHWPLIGELWGEKKARHAYRHFANFVAASWCGKGQKAHHWQMFATLPRNIGCTPNDQKKAYAEIASLARRLEKAMRNPAVSPVMGDEAMCRPGTISNRAMLPFVRHGARGDSVLTRLYTAAENEPIVHAAGWVDRPRSAGARETYFARHMAMPLLYFEQEGPMRSRIERFLADLTVELSAWENRVEDWGAERVRESLKKFGKGSPVRSEKNSS